MIEDTIAAVATAPGRGGVGIIRISGPQSAAIGKAICGSSLPPRAANFCHFTNSNDDTIDTGICLYFPGPKSFTGEDVLELQAHGGPVILDILLKEAFRLGARQARPGEFSERAYLNDKIDLAQAEAIADLINSTTEKAALNASRSLQGAFSRKIHDLVAEVTNLRIYTEAAIDFPEEEIDFIQDVQVKTRLADIVEQFQSIADQAKQGSLIQEGMKLVIAGKPNAGKSSLLNTLAGQETAIVTEIEGTTRDVLRQQIQIDGIPVHIVDTAGLRDSSDEIEQEGIRRAWLEIESADHILLLVDGSEHQTPSIVANYWPDTATQLSRDIPTTVVLNKIDLSGQAPSAQIFDGSTLIHLSAKTHEGIDLLKEHLKKSMGYNENSEGNFSARRRHLQSLETAEKHLVNGQQQLLLAGAGELLAEDLRQCQHSLGEITGVVTSDELLGKIFSNFCIGK